MKLSFTIYGFARAAGRPRSTALLPKGGVATQKRAQEILKFYGTNPIPPAERQVIAEAIGLQARAHTYLPKPDKDWRNTILTFLIAERVRQDPLWDGPIVLEATFYFPVPKSYAKRIHEAVARGERIPRVVQEDTEQLIKPIKDAARGIIWRDDVLVYDEHVVKIYGAPPRVEVSLELEERRRVR